MVVARVGGEVTVKRLKRRGHAVQLLPENPEFEPIELDLRQDELTIEGVGLNPTRAALVDFLISFGLLALFQSSEGLDVSFDYRRPLSTSRKMTLGLSTGTSRVSCRSACTR